jgi:hypothetical protein
MADGKANEVPLTITSLSPSQATVNSPDLTISVSGTGFRYDTLVNWDGTQITPVLVSTSQLTFVVPSSLLRSAGTATVTLSNPRTGGGTASASFPVNSIPVLLVSSSTLDFGSVPVSTSSAEITITLTSTGTAQLHTLNLTITGDFTQTSNCSSSLAVNASCTISVVFTPSAAGTRNGSLSIGSNAPDAPQSVALTGSELVW